MLQQREGIRPKGLSFPEGDTLGGGVLICKAHPSSHKKPKEISACGNVAAQMHISGLLFLAFSVNKHEQSALTSVGLDFFFFPS